MSDVSFNIPLGPFTALEPIGQGGMGEVWFGVHDKQRTAVAIKVISAEYAREPEFVAAFEAEVQAVARLNHPGVVMVLDFGTIPPEAQDASQERMSAGDPYLVMEMASGGTLQDRPLPTDWISLRDTLLSLLDALAHAHARGVIHRDVKPGNVLLALETDFRPGLKLTDFGLAAAGERLRAEKLTGTPAYMAPEQCDGRWRDHGPWTDLYGFGCLAYALSSGELPFDDTNPMQVVLRQFAMQPPPLKPLFEVPDGFEKWLLKLMAKKPMERFRWAADAAFALRSLDDPAAPSVFTGAAGLADQSPVPETWQKKEAEQSVRRRVAESHAMELIGAGLGLYGLRSIPLVGRQGERDVAWRALRAVEAEGEPRVVVLSGEAGTGKSRLAEWIGQRAHETGAASVLRANHSATVAGPTEGIPRMFSRALRCHGLERTAVRQRITEMLQARGLDEEYEADALTELLMPASPDDIEAGARVIQFSGPEERHAAARRLLELVSENRPVIIHVDDAQWGLDLLGFIQHLMENSGRFSLPVLFLLTVRSDLLAERPLESGRLQEINHDPRTDVVPVELLTGRDRTALIRQLLGLEGQLAAEVEKRTDGNPLFAVQLVGDWVERGMLEVGSTGFRLREGVRAELPDDIHSLWSGRVDRVLQDHEVGRVSLELAAALGVEVALHEWKTACQIAGVAIPDSLVPSMVAVGLAQRTNDGLAFAHGMLRESIERTAREAGRWPRHNSTCATMIERLYPEHARQRSERMGRHLVEAGELRRAVDLLLAAANERQMSGDYRIAVALLERREECLRTLQLSSDSPQWANGWVAMANNLRLVGRVDESAGYAAQAESAARVIDDQSLLADAYRAQGHITKEKGDFGAAQKRYELALELYERLEELRLSEKSVRKKSGGEESAEKTDARKKPDSAGQAADVSGRDEHTSHLSDCYWGLGVIALVQGDLDGARRFVERALELGLLANDRARVANARHQLAGIALKQQRMQEAQEFVEAAYDDYDALGNRLGLSNCLNGLGEIHRYLGDFEEAAQNYRKALTIVESLQPIQPRVARINLALTLLQTGNFREARDLLETLRKELENQDARGLQSVIYVTLLPCVAAEQDWATFVRYYNLGKTLLEQTGLVDPDLAASAEIAAEQAAAADQPRMAELVLGVALEQWQGLGESEHAEAVRERIEELSSIP